MSQGRRKALSQVGIVLGALTILAALVVPVAWLISRTGRSWFSSVGLAFFALLALSAGVQVISDAVERKRMQRAASSLADANDAGEERASAADAPPVESWSQARIDERLADLLDGYRTAIRFVENVPFAHRRRVEGASGVFQGLRRRLPWRRPAGPPWQRRLVIRPLLRLFVEAHVRRQLLRVVRALRIQQLGVRPSDPEAKPLDDLIETLTKTESRLFGWSRIKVAFSKAPLLPAALAFGIAIYQAGTGIDLTDAATFGKSVGETAKTVGWAEVGRLLSTLALVAINFYALVIAPLAVAGFKRKRALFLGGRVPEGEDRRPFPVFWSVRGETIWRRFPEANVYELENRLFDVLAIRKRRELPVDVFLSVGPYFTSWGLALLATEAIQEGDWQGLGATAFVAIYLLVDWTAAFTRRIRSSNR